jgi:hypothetical protein
MGSDGSGTTTPTSVFNARNFSATTTTVVFPVTLSPSTKYYVQIAPFNIVGPATNCPITNFTTVRPVPAFPQYCQNFTNFQLPVGWVNDPNDGAYNWNFGQVTNYGPRTDHTTGSGYFAWVSDGFYASININLLTPHFDLTPFTNPILDMWVWISSSQSGTIFSVDISTDSVNYGIGLIHSPTLYQVWVNVKISIGAYRSPSTRLRFRVSKNYTGSFNNDIAIDDVCIYEGGSQLTTDSPTTFIVIGTTGPIPISTTGSAVTSGATSGNSGPVTTDIQVSVANIPSYSLLLLFIVTVAVVISTHRVTL